MLKSFKGSREHLEGGGRDWFTQQELRKNLGDDFKLFLKGIYEFYQSNLGYSQGYSTKAYQLWPSVRKTLTAILRNPPGKDSIVDANGVTRYRTGVFPNNGIVPTSTSRIRVPSIVPIDLKTLDETISLAEVHEDPADLTAPVSLLINKLYHVRRWVVATGGVPNFYRVQPHGRLGGLGDFSLVTAKRELRKLILRKSGFIDYDFQNCYPAIFVSLCSSVGVNTPVLESYVNDRDKWFDLFSTVPFLTRSVTKRIFLTLLNDTRAISASTYYGVGKIVNEVIPSNGYQYHDVMDVLIDIIGKQLKLQEEIEDGHEKILSTIHPLRSTQNNRKFTKNVVGKFLYQKDATKDTTRMSYVLAGYERWCLETVCSGLTGDVKVLINDGFVSSGDHDLKKLEKLVRDESQKEFGFRLKMKLSKKEFTDSVDDILKDIT